jgi:hypothetical protein
MQHEERRAAGRGGGRARETPEPVSADGLAGWLTGRLPGDWFEEPPAVEVDREEVLVVGRVPAPDLPAGADAAARAEAEAGRLARFREETREQRMRIARETERRYGRVVSWGAESGETRRLFTTLSVPVMTRLRQPERQVLDTLVESGVARSRADALAWCVKLVGRHTDAWLGELREALEAVQRVRAEGPAAGS